MSRDRANVIIHVVLSACIYTLIEEPREKRWAREEIYSSCEQTEHMNVGLSHPVLDPVTRLSTRQQSRHVLYSTLQRHA